MCDAEGCYDRINHTVAILALHRQGVPKAAARSAYITLQRAHHHISTGYGVSGPQYGGKRQDPPIQGEGQGNGKAPTTWALISAVLIEMMYRANHGAQLISAISAMMLWLVCFAFVNDTDVIHTDENPFLPGEELMPQFQEAMDRWEGGLRASGGALVPNKSFWYLIDFQWSEDKWQYWDEDEMPGGIQIWDTTHKKCITLQ